jgi:hypothetical protein
VLLVAGNALRCISLRVELQYRHTCYHATGTAPHGSIWAADGPNDLCYLVCALQYVLVHWHIMKFAETLELCLIQTPLTACY